MLHLNMSHNARLNTSHHAGVISFQNVRDRKISLSVISHVGMRHVACRSESCRASEHVMSRRADFRQRFARRGSLLRRGMVGRKCQRHDLLSKKQRSLFFICLTIFLLYQRVASRRNGLTKTLATWLISAKSTVHLIVYTYIDIYIYIRTYTYEYIYICIHICKRICVSSSFSEEWQDKNVNDTIHCRKSKSLIFALVYT